MAKTALDWLKGDGDHHPYGPSNFPAWSHCSCYESTPVPEGDISHPANRGTLMHIAFEYKLMRGYVPKEIAEELSSDELDGVMWAVEWVEQGIPAPLEKYSEEKVTCIDGDFNELYSGTLDLMWVDGEGCLNILDLKTGEERDYHMQLMGYALPAMEARGVDMCLVHVLNTRYRSHNSEVIRKEEARTSVLALLEDVQAVDIDPMPCDYCAWCTKQPTCPALVEGAVTIAQGYDESAPTFDFDNFHSSEVTDPVVMGKMYQAALIVEKWAKSVKAHAADLAIKDGRGIRQAHRHSQDQGPQRT